MTNSGNSFSAAPQGLGYIYQVRFALLQMFMLPEETECFIERDDDIDFSDDEEGKILASLKHKAPGDALNDLSVDFWKSVRVWLEHFTSTKSSVEPVKYFLFTTGSVVAGSFLENFLPNAIAPEGLGAEADELLLKTKSKTLSKTKEAFDQLDEEEKDRFLSRITIFDEQIRIVDIPEKVMAQYMRTVPIKLRLPVYQRLEGWWYDLAISLMDGERKDPASGIEVSEMFHMFSSQYREDNLPIDFRGAEPPEGADPHNDSRLFVEQLRMVGVKKARIRRAILDYYRAFEQRGSWAREHVTITGEVGEYDDRLVDEWDRMKNIIWEELDDESLDEELKLAGRKLLTWFEGRDDEKLRIRPQVTEPYVLMGSLHMLANEDMPRVHWHPHFLSRLGEILAGGAS